MKIQIKIDDNGNKIAKVTNGRNSFSIQTNGNLPETHNGNLAMVKEEIKNYVSQYGTERQKAIFNL
jgi:hypothetical protein